MIHFNFFRRNLKKIIYLLQLLEISSGTGQHIVEFATKFPYVTFQPSEVDARSLHSIVAYIDHYRLANVRVPLYIDVSKPVSHWALPTDYGPSAVDVILNINMIHISSDAAVEGLFRASKQFFISTSSQQSRSPFQASGTLLKRGSGLLITYGPYAIDGVITPQSNVAFHDSLRNENPEWGLRDIRDLNELAIRYGMRLVARHDMPANNHTLIFSRD
ncbi:unnamed protein product [Haemonchus placei]|uniref:Glyco_hydro_2 domain-containing protein n=1 Tax=Haemonchus placei TaxID=6290 RepID=A0A0N4WKV6_HAEPC|nr:unnamed protein product [Haemonchus placei]